MYKNHTYDYSVHKAIGNSFTALAEKQSASTFCNHLVGRGLHLCAVDVLAGEASKLLGIALQHLLKSNVPTLFAIM